MSRKSKKKRTQHPNGPFQSNLTTRQKRLEHLKKTGEWQGVLTLLASPHDAQEAWQLVRAFAHLQRWGEAVEVFHQHRSGLDSFRYTLPIFLKNAGREDEAVLEAEQILTHKDVSPRELVILADSLSDRGDRHKLTNKPQVVNIAARLLERAVREDSAILPEFDRAGEWAYRLHGHLLWQVEIDPKERQAIQRSIYRKGYELYLSEDLLELLSDTLEPADAIQLLEQQLMPFDSPELGLRWLERLLRNYQELDDPDGLGRVLAHPNLEIDADSASWLRATSLARSAKASDDPRLLEARSLSGQLPSGFNTDLLASLYLYLASVSWHMGDLASWHADSKSAFELIASSFWHFSASGPESIAIRVRSDLESSATLLIMRPTDWQDAVRAFAMDTSAPIEDRSLANLVLAVFLQEQGQETEALEMTRHAVKLVGETPWSDFLLEQGSQSTVEQLLAYKRSVLAIRKQDPSYDRSFYFWFNPEDSVLDEVQALHAGLLSWPPEFPSNLIAQTQLDAWHDGQWQEALKKHGLHRELVEAAEVIVQHEEDAETLFALGYYALQIAEPAFSQKAVDAFGRYLEMVPDDAPALNNLGIAYERHGQLAEALESFQRALEQDPQNEKKRATVERIRAKLSKTKSGTSNIDLHFVDGIIPRDKEIAQSYWQQDDAGGWSHTLKALSTQFRLTNAQIKDLTIKQSWALSTSIRCSGCGEAYEYTSRQDFSDRQGRNQTYTCAKCQEGQRAAAQAETVKTLETQKGILQRRFDMTSLPALELASLTLEDAVYLLSVARVGASENLRYIEPFNELKHPLGPTLDFGEAILKHLLERQILRIHPVSSPAAFTWQGDEPAHFKIREVHWGIAMGGPQLPFGSVIEKLEERFRVGARAWPQTWNTEVGDVWRKTVLQEALRHLLLCLEDHGFTISPGEKTIIVLRTMIEEFSLAQIWSMIWSSAKNAAAYYVRERIPKQQAANSVITGLQRYAERAKSEGWKINAARRDRRTPEPIVSQVFFTTALHLGVSYQDQLPAASGPDDSQPFLN